MKTIIFSTLATLCLLFSTSVQAQDPYFFSQKGMVVEYSVADAKGDIQSYSKSTVTDLKKKDAKNFTVTYATEVFDKNRKSLAAPVSVTVEIVDGVITFDPAASMGEAGANAEITGTYPSFPTNLEVGQDLGAYEYKMKMMGMTSTVSGKSKVTAKEKITTKGGSFDCYKVESEISSKALMSSTKVSSASWYARGIGAVKTETYDKKGNIQAVQELVSLQK